MDVAAIANRRPIADPWVMKEMAHGRQALALGTRLIEHIRLLLEILDVAETFATMIRRHIGHPIGINHTILDDIFHKEARLHTGLDGPTPPYNHIVDTDALGWDGARGECGRFHNDRS